MTSFLLFVHMHPSGLSGAKVSTSNLAGSSNSTPVRRQLQKLKQVPTGKLVSFSSPKVARMESAVKEKIEVDLKLAIAVALLKRGLHSGCTEMEESQSRKKAKLMEEELSMVKEELEEIRGALVLDQLPLLAPCKCHFFAADTERLKSHQTTTTDDLSCKPSVQTFLKNVRILRRSKQTRASSHLDGMKGNLVMVVDFVVDLSCRIKSIHLTGKHAEAYIHHAVEFIKDATPLLLEDDPEEYSIVGALHTRLVLSLVMQLLNFNLEDGEGEVDANYQHWIQLLILKLGALAFIGHRVLLVSTQQIAAVLERLFCMDPFENKFCQIYENLYFVFELVRRLVTEHFATWGEGDSLQQVLLEEWIACHFQLRSAIQERRMAWSAQLLLAMDRITENMLELLQCSAESNAHGQDSWHQALLHLITSASAAIAGI